MSEPPLLTSAFLWDRILVAPDCPYCGQTHLYPTDKFGIWLASCGRGTCELVQATEVTEVALIYVPEGNEAA